MSEKKRRSSSLKPEDYMCGIGSWRPKWMQIMATPKMFLLINGIIGILQGASYTYIIASATTLEKRYAFGSKITGLILIADNVSELIFGPIFGYLAHRVHRPRFIGYSQMICGLGLFLAATPYFVYGPTVHLLSADPLALNSVLNTSNRTIDFCDDNKQFDTKCDDNSGSNTVIPAVVMLWLSTCLNGLGSSAYYTIGIPFIDDSVKKKNSPLYISITGALRLCGPTLGFMLSSLVLRFYENPLIDPGITDLKDPRWVGAWWIGFVVLGTGIFFFSFFMFLFPREFRQSRVKNKTSSLNPENKSNSLIDGNKLESELDMRLWARVKRLLKNPIYMSVVIGTQIRLFAVLGYMTFKAKYIESEYRKSASTANLFSGMIGIVPSAIGIFLGGFFIKYLQPGPKLLTSFVGVVELFGSIGLFAAIFLGCPVSQFAGTQVNNNFELKTMCNDKCFCSETVFQPICDVKTKTNYFSACFAGCEAQSLIQNTDKPNQYTDCQCLEGPAVEGYCDNNCGNNFETYITLMGISNIVGNLAKTGNTIISFRIVDKLDKSFSLGLTSAFFCLFAFIPYPLVYGAVADAACLVWERTCGQRGNCWVYDSTKFRQYLHGLTLTCILLGSVFDIIVIFLSKRIKHLYNDDIQEVDGSVDAIKSDLLNDKYINIPFIDAAIDDL